MFKQVFRLTFVTFIWKQYKRYIVSIALLFAYFWFVGFAHTEYLEFAATQENTNVGTSFFIKWFALLIGVSAFFLFHYLAPSRKELKQKVKVSPPKQGEPDPFEQIRNKEKLRTRAEIIIDEQKSG